MLIIGTTEASLTIPSLDASSNQTQNTEPLLSITLKSDRAKYVSGQAIRLTGNVLDDKGQPVETTLMITMQSIGDDVITSKSFVPVRSGAYNIVLNAGEAAGDFKITASSAQNQDNETVWVIVQVQELFLSSLTVTGFMYLFAVVVMIVGANVYESLGPTKLFNGTQTMISVAAHCTRNPAALNVTHISDCRNFTPGSIAEDCAVSPKDYELELSQCSELLDNS